MVVPTILAINPGSTSTATALFRGEERLAWRDADSSFVSSCERSSDGVEVRAQEVLHFLDQHGCAISNCTAIAARGGPLRPVPGGVYRVNDIMLDDARSDVFADHVSKYACLIADRLAQETHVPAFVVDPISTDEYADISRISGVPSLPRKSLTHALNMKRVARIVAESIGRVYEDTNIITAHLGGGISIAVHHRGRMIDSCDSNGDGPFSPQRSGALRADDLARWSSESGKAYGELRAILSRESGLLGHLGTSDAREVQRRIGSHDAQAALVFSALAYNVSKHIAGLSVAVRGEVDAIVLTGGLANSQALTTQIQERVRFLAPIHIIPGSCEMEALREGVARVLSGRERARVYPTGEFE